MRLFRLGTSILALSTLALLTTGDSAAATLGPAPPTTLAGPSAPNDPSTRQAEPTPVPSRPDLTVGYPDLTVELSHWSGDLEPGEKFNFAATIKNNGHGPGKPVRVLMGVWELTNVRVTGADGFTCTVESTPHVICKGGQVPAGQEVAIQLEAKAPEKTGDYRMEAIVDPQNAVDERNEDNNRVSRTFHVRRCASVDC